MKNEREVRVCNSLHVKLVHIVPDPGSDEGREIIGRRLAEAVEQLKQYSPALDDFGKDVTAFAIVFVGDTCVERVRVDIL